MRNFCISRWAKHESGAIVYPVATIMSRCRTMKCVILSLFSVYLLSSKVIGSELPTVTTYHLQIQLFPADERFEATCEVTLINQGDEPIEGIPVLLYRLLEVTAVFDLSGQSIWYKQRITRLADDRACQVNALSVFPLRPLEVGDSLKLRISYRGYIYGYPEIMQYTKDRISEDYSLIRNDVFAYPIFSDTSWASLFQSYRSKFTYTASVEIPKDYMVASGGALVGVDTTGDTAIYRYRSKVPVSRIDIAAAHFICLNDSASLLSTYYLPGDSVGAQHIMQAMREVVPYYEKRFGPAPGYAGFTVIEIPDGWGSQAGRFYILQTAAAFKDTARISEVYHEVGHSWNATVDPSVQRCRYFDEAFASYFEAMSLGHFQGDSAFQADMESSRRRFIQHTETDSLGRWTPIAQYGVHEIGGYSYTKGAWSLYVLNRLLDDDDFNALIRAMLTKFTDKPIDFQSFKILTEDISRQNLDKFFEEWIFGTASTKLMLDNTPIDSLVQRYR